MLTVVPTHAPSRDRAAEARELLLLVEFWRPSLWAVTTFGLLLLAAALVAAGVAWAGAFFLGSAVTLTAHRYGPRYRPGRR